MSDVAHEPPTARLFHVTEYLAKVAWAAYPQRSPSQAEVKTGQPERQQWLHDRCHPLKHEPDAARDILTEMRAFKRKLSESVATLKTIII